MIIQLDEFTYVNVNQISKILISDSESIKKDLNKENIADGYYVVLVMSSLVNLFGSIENDEESEATYTFNECIPEHIIINQVFNNEIDARSWIKRKFGIFFIENFSGSKN